MLLIVLILVGMIQTSSMISRARLVNAKSITVSSKIYEIDGLLSWYDVTSESAFGTTIPNNNSNVTFWNDALPASLNFSGSATYVDKAINGLPALSFDGTSNNMSATDYPANLLNDSGATIFLVMNFNAAANVTLLAKGSDDIRLSQINAGTLTGFFNNSSQAFSGLTGSNVVASFVYTRGTGITENIRAYRNGTLIGDFNITTTIVSPSNSLFIGSKIDGSQKASFKIAELIIFKRSLNDTERKDLESYLGSKWGIAVR